MRSLSKRLALGIGAPALLIGALIVGAVAVGAQTPPQPTPTPQTQARPKAQVREAAREYLSNVFARAAGKLNVDQARLLAAFKDAAKEEVDAAAQAGRITPQQAERAKQRIDNRSFGFLAPGVARAQHGAHLKLDVAKGHAIETVAQLTQQSREDVIQQLRSGTSLAQIAAEKGVSEETLLNKLVEPVQARLQQAVTSGQLTQARADQMLARARRLAERMVEHTPRQRS